VSGTDNATDDATDIETFLLAALRRNAIRSFADLVAEVNRALPDAATSAIQGVLGTLVESRKVGHRGAPGQGTYWIRHN
jgi:hypothetical protein